MRALAVCAKDLRQRLRDRSIVLVGIVAPLGLATILGLALGSPSFSTTLGYANLDKSELTKGLDETLGSKELGEVAKVRRFRSEQAVREAVKDGTVAAGIVVPRGFQDQVANGNGGRVEIVADPADSISSSVAEGVVEGYLSRVRAGQLAIATAVALLGPGVATGPDAKAGELASTAAESLPAVDFRKDPVTARLRPVDSFSAAMAILFLYFTILTGAATLQAERRTHTFARLAVSPASPMEVLGGKLLALFLTGMLVMAVVIVATGLLFDVRWGNPLAVAALTATTVLSGIGLTGVIAVVSKTEEQVRQVGAAVVFLLAALGGNFFSGNLPPVLKALQVVTPNGQALIGYTDLMVAGARGGLGTVAAPLAVTSAVAAVGVAITMVRGKKVFVG